MNSPIKVALCIPTCNRPEDLSKCLREINRLEIDPTNFHIEVIVVDNGSIIAAKRVFESETSSCRFNHSYHVEKRKGIPIVRNRCIEIASAKQCTYLAFIDDDEYPDKMWLNNLLSFAADNNADIVTGPVLSHLPEIKHRRWIYHCDVFNRIRHPHNSTVPIFATNNVLISMDILHDTGLRFDESMAFCGGSDQDLSIRLVQKGKTILWCDTALAHETVPESRCTKKWIMHRFFRIGSDRAQFKRKYNLCSFPRLRFFVKGTAMFISGFILLLGSLGIHQYFFGKALRNIGLGIGFISGSLGVTYQEYRKYHRVEY